MPEDFYSTSDFHDVVYLLCLGGRLSKVVRVGPTKVSFVFENKEKCEALAKKSMFDDKVSLSLALHEIKRARDLIRNTP